MLLPKSGHHQSRTAQHVPWQGLTKPAGTAGTHEPCRVSGCFCSGRGGWEQQRPSAGVPWHQAALSMHTPPPPPRRHSHGLAHPQQSVPHTACAGFHCLGKPWFVYFDDKPLQVCSCPLPPPPPHSCTFSGSSIHIGAPPVTVLTWTSPLSTVL